MGKNSLSILGQKVSYKSNYDKSQLEKINREERREGYVKMYGVDVWTAYEFSYLLPNGLPQYHVLRIFNPADSINIFESKSLKLYLNSFNNTVFEGLEEAVKRVSEDLTEIAGREVFVKVVSKFEEDCIHSLAENIDVEFEGKIEQYNYDKTLLKVIETSATSQKLTSLLLRSNCEITHQPDWARIYINYSGDRSLDKHSLLKYIVSYRNHSEFHEPTCERIYQDLYEVLRPATLTVLCQYTRRGGIDINPLRTSHPLFKVNVDLPKLLQQ